MAKRIKTIMIPYFLWAFIYANGINIKNIVYICYANNRTLGESLQVLWFLPCLFVADLLVIFIIWISEKIRIGKFIFIFPLLCWGCGMGLSIILPHKIGFPFSVDVAFVGAGFILVGYSLKELSVFEQIKKWCGAWKLLFIGVCFLGTFLFSFWNDTAKEGTLGRVVMALSEYGHFLMFVCAGITGSMVVIGIAMLLENEKVSILQRIGKKTILILVIHQFYINYLEKIVWRLCIDINILIWLIMALTVLFISWITAECIVIICPNLMGKYVCINNESDYRVNSFFKKKRE